MSPRWHVNPEEGAALLEDRPNAAPLECCCTLTHSEEQSIWLLSARSVSGTSSCSSSSSCCCSCCSGGVPAPLCHRELQPSLCTWCPGTLQQTTGAVSFHSSVAQKTLSSTTWRPSHANTSSPSSFTDNKKGTRWLPFLVKHLQDVCGVTVETKVNPPRCIDHTLPAPETRLQSVRHLTPPQTPPKWLKMASGLRQDGVGGWRR